MIDMSGVGCGCVLVLRACWRVIVVGVWCVCVFVWRVVFVMGYPIKDQSGSS